MRVALEPATTADFERVVGGRPVRRARALAAKLDGETIGVGGFLTMPDGRVWASMVATPKGREFPAAIFRAGVLAMRMARRIGLKEVLASPDANEPAAERFLQRLGFEPIGTFDGETVHRWRC